MTRDQIEKVAVINHRILESLIQEDYIQSKKSYSDDLTIYFPTKKAREFLQAEGTNVFVNCLTRPALKNELHDRRLTDIRITFEHMGYSHWQSERCLHQRGMNEVRPDAILSIERRKIAIELEPQSRNPEHRTFG